MLVFYSESRGRPNVSAESPVDETLENVLAIFRSLDQRRGFIGIYLRSPFVLQLMPSKNRVRIELVDTSKPVVDSCEVYRTFAEQLIEAASKGWDVFQIARQAVTEWEHIDLG